MKSQSFRIYLCAALILLIFVCFCLCIVATQLNLWGDEFDTINPVFLNWHGHKNFWWLLGQYNAQAPGDNLFLKFYFKSNLLNWLFTKSEELFWRLPYITLFFATSISTFLLSYKYCKSSTLAFLAFIFCLLSPGLLIYSLEVRFYSWLIFFMTITIFLFLELIEEFPKKLSLKNLLQIYLIL